MDNLLALTEADLTGNKPAIQVLLQSAADTAEDASLKVLIGEAQKIMSNEDVDLETFKSLMNSAKMIAG